MSLSFNSVTWCLNSHRKRYGEASPWGLGSVSLDSGFWESWVLSGWRCTSINIVMCRARAGARLPSCKIRTLKDLGQLSCQVWEGISLWSNHKTRRNGRETPDPSRHWRGAGLQVTSCWFILMYGFFMQRTEAQEGKKKKKKIFKNKIFKKFKKEKEKSSFVPVVLWASQYLASLSCVHVWAPL